MRIGAFVPAAQFPGRSHADALAHAVDTALIAEEAGFDDVWFAEHHFMSYGVCPSALTMAAFVLGRTRRIGVGTAVSVLSTDHPVAVAERANLLDHLGEGRLRLGVGRGSALVDLEVFGTGLERYERGFGESLDVLLASLGGGRIRADGATFGFREVEVVPGPRGPRRPVWVAAGSEASVEAAAARGLPLMSGMHQTAHQQAQLLSRYAEYAGEWGNVPEGGHIVTTVAHVGDAGPATRRDVAASLAEWLTPGLAGYVGLDGRKGTDRDPRRYAHFLSEEHAVGTSEECVDNLARRARETGAEELIMLVQTTGDAKATQENVARLGAEVLPGVRR